MPSLLSSSLDAVVAVADIAVHRDVSGVHGLDAAPVVAHADVGGNGGKRIVDDTGGVSVIVPGGRIDRDAADGIAAADVVLHHEVLRHGEVARRRGPDAARGDDAPPPVVARHVVDDDVVEGGRNGDAVPGRGVRPLNGLLNHVAVDHGSHD